MHIVNLSKKKHDYKNIECISNEYGILQKTQSEKPEWSFRKINMIASGKNK